MTFSLSVISFIIEFLIALNCLGDIMEEKLKKRYTFLIGISLYAVALVVFVLIENVYINAFVFFVINFLFAYLCFECTVKNGILCSLFLTVMMVVTEFLFILGYSITENGNIITYSTNLASYTIGAVLSKLMYFVLTKLIIYFGFNFRRPFLFGSFLFFKYLWHYMFPSLAVPHSLKSWECDFIRKEAFPNSFCGQALLITNSTLYNILLCEFCHPMCFSP